MNVATGEIKQQINYDEFGNVLLNTNEDFQPFAYAGGVADTQTKLVRFGARDYDSFTGRWTTKDPIGFNAGVSNFYEYVLNDPINYIDIDGMQIVLPFPTPIPLPFGANPDYGKTGEAIDYVVELGRKIQLVTIGISTYVLDKLFFSKSRYEKGETYLTLEAKSSGQDPCDYLLQKLKEAKACKNKKLIKDIEKALKFLGCRNKQKRSK